MGATAFQAARRRLAILQAAETEEQKAPLDEPVKTPEVESIPVPVAEEPGPTDQQELAPAATEPQPRRVRNRKAKLVNQ